MTTCRLDYVWQNYVKNATNQAYDPIVFPERQCLAERNARNATNGTWRCNPYTVHLLDKFLPVEEDNPNHPCKSRNQRCQVSYSRRCRCQCRDCCYRQRCGGCGY